MIEIKLEIDLKDLKKEAKRVKTNYYLYKAGSIGEAIAVNQSPVDTGLLRANWFLTTEASNKKINYYFKHKKTPRININKNSLYLTNNIFYTTYANITSFRPQFIEKTISKLQLALAEKDFYKPKAKESKEKS